MGVFYKLTFEYCFTPLEARGSRGSRTYTTRASRCVPVPGGNVVLADVDARQIDVALLARWLALGVYHKASEADYEMSELRSEGWTAC